MSPSLADNPLRERRLSPRASPSLFDKGRRLAWIVIEQTLYRWSPVPLHGWRRLLLRTFGARVRAGAHPYPSARIWAPWNLEMGERSCLGPRSICYNVATISLGDDSIVSQGAHLCSATHDHRDPAFTLVAGPITVGSNAWVAAEAFVGPGVDIGESAVIGARAVVMKDVAPSQVMAGNPARAVATR